MRRDSRGRILPGPMPEELKQKISQGQIARYKRQRAQLSEAPPVEWKRCSKCGEMKKVPDDFSMGKRKLASGEETRYPEAACKTCSAERSAAHREKLRREGVYAEHLKRWNEKRDKEARTRYNRDYQRVQRRLQGIPERGPWRRYRHEVDLGRDVRVSRAYFNVVVENSRLSPTELQSLTGIDESVFRSKHSRIFLSTVDTVFTALGIPDQVAAAYLDDVT